MEDIINLQINQTQKKMLMDAEINAKNTVNRVLKNIKRI
jgi:hypothetical protein